MPTGTLPGESWKRERAEASGGPLGEGARSGRWGGAAGGVARKRGVRVGRPP